MMVSIDTIKEKLRDILIEKDGNVQPWDLVHIVAEAKGIGLDEYQINRLLQKVDRSINWEAVKKQKEEIARKKEELEKAAAEAEKAKRKPAEVVPTDRKISDPKMEKTTIPTPNPVSSPRVAVTSSNDTSFSFPWKALITAVLLIIVFGGAIFYLFWLRPYWRDKDAERMYSFAEDLSLRSSPQPGVEYNFLKKLSFGEELLVYDKSGDWATVKVDGQEGYVYSQYIMNKRDFIELNAIFGDTETKETIATTKCRKALLNYYRDHNIIGKIDPSLIKEVGDSIQNKEVWQVFSRGKNTKPNTVIFPKIVNTHSKFTDFGCLIKNLSTNKRKFLLFSFSDAGEPSLTNEQDAADSGYISSVQKTLAENGRPFYNVTYTQ